MHLFGVFNCPTTGGTSKKIIFGIDCFTIKENIEEINYYG